MGCSRVAYAVAVAVVAACGNPSNTTSSASDAPIDTVPGDGRIHVDDGSPTRQACTSSFGSGLSATPTFGRLDGYLVAIVPPSNSSACNADSSHVHLQVRMNGGIYDVAIDVTDGQTGVDDVHTTTRDLDMPSNLAWSEGWHTGVVVDYVALGVHSAALPLATKAALTTTLETDLASANHVSIYGTTYGAGGTHLIHRNGSGHDGLIVTEPLSTPSHLRLLSFTNLTF